MHPSFSRTANIRDGCRSGTVPIFVAEGRKNGPVPFRSRVRRHDAGRFVRPGGGAASLPPDYSGLLFSCRGDFDDTLKVGLNRFED
jgi:hypothetical protein